MSHISGQVKNLLSKITSVDQGNYPEMMGKTFIINAPGMFKLVWGIVKRFLDARTLTKIEASICKEPFHACMKTYLNPAYHNVICIQAQRYISRYCSRKGCFFIFRKQTNDLQFRKCTTPA